MTVFAVLILIALIAIPLVIEKSRSVMTQDARNTAPGEFAQLSKGVTHYNWYGPARGPVVVCVHGLTTPSFVWRSMVRGLAVMGFRCLTYDLYGRGYSDKPKGKQDAEFFLNQLNELLSDQGVSDDITIVGYSMGGAISTLFTAQNPSRVRQLILLAPAGMGIVAGRLGNFIVKTPVIGDWLMLAFYPGQLRKGIKAEADLPKSVEGMADLQENELRFRGYLPAVLASLRGVLWRALKEEHQIIQRAGIPVLAIWGREDTVIPIAAVGTLAEWSRNATQEIVDGAGHGLTYTHTDAVLRLIHDNLHGAR
ncbi:alpha/beta hydrolase [Ascidiaceihabitans sp.]|uniref:alpha/beta fold hydrolase n=1 Tax=Ascidiaceihabitans sp. TaxID=1872644 RepID=UPI00329908AD